MPQAYIFNPEHDLALANADPNFNAPRSARKLAVDLECLPLWFATPYSELVVADSHTEWFSKMYTLFPALTTITPLSKPTRLATIYPWGWDMSVVKKILNLTSESNNYSMPSESELEIIRRLSHRHTAIRAHQFLLKKTDFSDNLAPVASELTTIDDVEAFAIKHIPVIYKAPWSGSGKGLSWLRGDMTDSHRGWCRNIIQKQGSVIAEKAYPVSTDFAMLFECHNSQVRFEGYSLFETERGIYRSNLLLSNASIGHILTREAINDRSLNHINQLLINFIELEIAPYYNGMLGIDMFLYNDEEQIKFHPCVEINLRMTMGCVARRFFDHFVDPQSSGRFYVDHIPDSKALWTDHEDRLDRFPVRVQNQKIIQGYMNLTPVYPHTQYRIRVEIERNNK